MFNLIKDKINSDSKEEIERRYQNKKSLRHLIIVILVAVFSVIAYIIEDYIFTKTLDQGTIIFLLEISGVLLVFYAAISIFEFNLHYFDLKYFRLITNNVPLEQQLRKEFENIKNEFLPVIETKAKEESEKFLNQFIVKAKDEI